MIEGFIGDRRFPRRVIHVPVLVRCDDAASENALQRAEEGHYSHDHLRCCCGHAKAEAHDELSETKADVQNVTWLQCLCCRPQQLGQRRSFMAGQSYGNESLLLADKDARARTCGCGRPPAQSTRFLSRSGGWAKKGEGMDAGAGRSTHASGRVYSPRNASILAKLRTTRETPSPALTEAP